MKNTFISAGEASGDLHGAGLIAEIARLYPDTTFWGLGGSGMESEGVRLLYNVSELSTMGFVEPAKRLPFLRKVHRTITRGFDSDRPDAAILIDYPGMNFRFAEKLHRLGIPFVYYILPQVWAWHRSRIEKMKGWNAKFVSILPFEPDFYAQHGLPVEFYGHPLVDLAKPDKTPADFRASLGISVKRKLIAVLPGSRLQEVRRILPVVLSSLGLVRRRINDPKIVCRPADRSQNRSFAGIIERSKIDADIYNGSIYSLLSAADLTLVASGTATVEAAICACPAIVLYRTNWLTYLIARRLVNVNYISMANIIAGRLLYPELIQSDANPKRIASEAVRFLEDPDYAARVKSGAAEVLTTLGEGNAYHKAATEIVRYLFA